MLQDRRWVMGSKDHAIRQEAGQDKKRDRRPRRWVKDRRWVMGKDHAVRQEAGQDKKGDLISYQGVGLKTRTGDGLCFVTGYRSCFKNIKVQETGSDSRPEDGCRTGQEMAYASKQETDHSSRIVKIMQQDKRRSRTGKGI